MVKRKKHKSGDPRRVERAGSAASRNEAGEELDAVRIAVALVTAAHGSRTDLGDLLDDVLAEPLTQARVAHGLLTAFVGTSVETLDDDLGAAPHETLREVTSSVEVAPEARKAWHRAIETAAAYLAALADDGDPEDVGEHIVDNIGRGLESARYLLALTQLAHAFLLHVCDALDADVDDYLHSLALPIAADHGNDSRATRSTDTSAR